MPLTSCILTITVVACETGADTTPKMASKQVRVVAIVFIFITVPISATKSKRGFADDRQSS